MSGIVADGGLDAKVLSRNQRSSGSNRSLDAKRSVKICATEKITAIFADQFAAAVLKAGGAGGAEDGVMLVGGEIALRGGRGGICEVFGGFVCAGLHFDSVAQLAIFSTAVMGADASNDVRFDSRQNHEGESRWIAALAQCGMAV